MKTNKINVAPEKVSTFVFLGCLFLCNVDTILKRKWKNLIILTFLLEKLTKNAYVYHKYIPLDYILLFIDSSFRIK